MQIHGFELKSEAWRFPRVVKQNRRFGGGTKEVNVFTFNCSNIWVSIHFFAWSD